MKAVILAAGIGSRLRPLTDTIPKCLVPIEGKPLLQIWLEKLEKIGVKEVLINTHWLHRKVESFLKAERPNRNLEITTFYEDELLGSAGTLAANRVWLGEDSPFFIIYGDNLTWVNLSEMQEFHDTHGLPVTLGVFRSPHPERCGIAETDQNGTVTSFIEKPRKPKSNLAAAGVYLADHRIFDFFPNSDSFAGDVLDLGFDIFPKMAGKMKYFEIDQVIDIGTPEAYEAAQKLWMSRLEEQY